MLRIGHKYAFKADLRKSISRLVKESDDKFGKAIAAVSPQEKTNWQKWKLTMIKKLVKLQDKPSQLEERLKRGIQDLKKMEIIIKPADKNLGLVPIRGDIYNAMLRKWLSQPSFAQVTSFPHDSIVNELKMTLPRGMDKQKRYLITQHAMKNKEPAPFYCIPKIHKTQLGSRPITAQHSYVLSALSRHLAEVLNEFVKPNKDIGIDSKTTVKRLEELKLPDQFVFLTYDVEACYPSIDIDDALQTLYDNLEIMRQENGAYTRLLEMVMKKNFVKANGKLYLQKVGTATGTQVAPPFANLYLYFKFKQVLSDPSIHFQERFIDDGLLLVKTKEDATRIMEGLNQASPLNLTSDISDKAAIYLDIEVYKGTRYIAERKLDLKVYFKPTNKLLYLPAKSNHPGAMKTGIVRGEAIRTLRNTSSKTEWLKALNHIFKGLMARGYSPKAIKDRWKSVRFEERDWYITCSTPKSCPEGVIVRTSYNPKTQAIWKWMIATHPLTQVLQKRRALWNKKQGALLKKWPPRILWMDFRKVSHQTINSRHEWAYPSQRKRARAEEEDENARNVRLRLSNAVTSGRS